ncbi:hypothetical protein EYW49_09575 [Siculibacillus lacustris]|uniref:Uncharacterized protein n=1 Tax=Siculibacillus lacustris TaxID=1549641 RepID=A0A4Q9VQS6_9HYPH|nr:hypothetical protein [Siculibacillus lacustris]TBW38190.1 hypothetical protein EYW49_09575 [Siculibacillus lacustris]
MKRLLAALAVVVALVGCRQESPPRALLYRLTITVDTPEGPKVGSSVARLWVGFGDGPLGRMGAAIFFNVKGAATVVDLGARGYLFCLLDRDITRKGSDSQQGLLIKYAGRPYLDRPMPRTVDAIVEARPKTPIALENLPALVRFRDPAQPSTAEWIDPTDLEKAFGAGVAISRVDYEILGKPPMKPGAKLTDEIEVKEITDSIARVRQTIPWITLPRKVITEMVKGSDLEPMTKNHQYGRSIVESDFISGARTER